MSRPSSPPFVLLSLRRSGASGVLRLLQQLTGVPTLSSTAWPPTAAESLPMRLAEAAAFRHAIDTSTAEINESLIDGLIERAVPIVRVERTPQADRLFSKVVANLFGIADHQAVRTWRETLGAGAQLESPAERGAVEALVATDLRLGAWLDSRLAAASTPVFRLDTTALFRRGVQGLGELDRLLAFLGAPPHASRVGEGVVLQGLFVGEQHTNSLRQVSSHLRDIHDWITEALARGVDSEA